MARFTVYSDGCPACKNILSSLQSAVRKRGCGCAVEEVSCDGKCEAAKRLGFEGKSRPVVVRDDAVVHEGTLSEVQAAALLPTV